MAESAEGVRRGSGADSVYNELPDAGEGELPRSCIHNRGGFLSGDGAYRCGQGLYTGDRESVRAWRLQGGYGVHRHQRRQRGDDRICTRHGALRCGSGRGCGKERRNPSFLPGGRLRRCQTGTQLLYGICKADPEGQCDLNACMWKIPL